MREGCVREKGLGGLWESGCCGGSAGLPRWSTLSELVLTHTDIHTRTQIHMTYVAHTCLLHDYIHIAYTLSHIQTHTHKNRTLI